MKLSREKMIRLSHLVLDHLNHNDAVEFFDDLQAIRQDIFRMIEAEMRTDEQLDALARRKIESQKRTISEGSSEWDILYRKYYEEEAERHRKVLP